jgi:hypothetical protein
MPIEWVKDEILYRRTQRQLGETQVALGLALRLQKALPELEGIQGACTALLLAKNDLMARILRMEQE